MTLKVALLMGGISKEREVSLKTGENCYLELKKLGYKITTIDLNKSLINNSFDFLKIFLNEKFDFCFNALHGGLGENGSIPGFLNIINIPYTHSGVRASSIAIDKIVTKQVLKVSEINFPHNIDIDLNKTNEIDLPNSNFPLVIKPKTEGSSIGLKIIESLKDLSLINYKNQNDLMAEEFIEGTELTVGVLNGKALCVTEIIPKTANFYNYNSKYLKNGSEHILPAKIPKKVYQKAMKWSEIAYRMLGCRGIARADFKFSPIKDKLYMLEINTHPGMTATSLIPEQAKYCGISFNKLILNLSEQAKCD